MEITSSGTGGPRPDPALDENGLRVHGILSAAPIPAQLARSFHAAGWSARKSTWNEYEVGQTWAELRLFVHEGTSILSGSVLPDHVDDLLRALDGIADAYRGELCDPSGALIRTFAIPDG